MNFPRSILAQRLIERRLVLRHGSVCIGVGCHGHAGWIQGKDSADPPRSPEVYLEYHYGRPEGGHV